LISGSIIEVYVQKNIVVDDSVNITKNPKHCIFPDLKSFGTKLGNTPRNFFRALAFKATSRIDIEVRSGHSTGEAANVLEYNISESAFSTV
jgi:hypothetical protein